MKQFILFITLYILSVAQPLLAERADSIMMQFVREEGLIEYSTNDYQLFKDGTSTFNSLFRDIDQAQSKVWIEFMIVANDSIGSALIDHLSAAARRGCDVRLIVDDYKDFERGFGYRTKNSQKAIRAKGIDLVLFDRFRFPWLNHVCRDHRKIVVIDDRIGYIGGLNVADYYVNGNPKYGAWRDTHVRLSGSSVEGLAILFDQHYNRYGGEKDYSFTPDSSYYISTDKDKVVYFERSRTTSRLKSQTRRAIIAALDAARDTVRIVSPYFLPTHTVRQAIIRTLDRGVYVEILFSKVGDNPMLSYGNMNFARRLVRHGAHVYLYRGAFHHSKIMMVDGQFAMIGSANLNSRSLKWDYEASCFIFSSGATRQLESIFTEDKKQCDSFSKSYYRSEFSFGQRTAGWLIDRFMTPIL